jgi:hypothetical protein
MEYAGQVTGMARRETHAWVWCGNLTERYNLEDLGANVTTTLKWIFKEI